MRALHRHACVPLAVLAVVVSFAGCARGVSGGTAGPGAPGDGGGVALPWPGESDNPDDGLAAWSAFPVNHKPRPIVLVRPSLVTYAGYTTDNAKIAAGAGLYRLAVTLPPDPRPTPIDLPGGPATLPLIGAAGAIERMKADGRGTPVPSVPPLAIVGIEFGTAPIETDRGTLTLPVWRVHTADEVGPTTVLALADSALASRAGSTAAPERPATGSAKLSTDGRQLTLTVQEEVPHCPGEAIYKQTAAVRESATAVAVVFTSRTQVGVIPTTDGMGCPAYIQLGPVTYRVDLAAPLGNRVLVDTDGNPQPVTTG